MKDQQALPISDCDHLNKMPLFVRLNGDDLIFERSLSISACDAVGPRMTDVLSGTSMFERVIVDFDIKHGSAIFV